MIKDFLVETGEKPSGRSTFSIILLSIRLLNNDNAPGTTVPADHRFLSSMALKPEGARTDFYRGLGYLYLGDDAQAARKFESAYALDSTYPHAIIGRAISASLSNQNSDGERLLREFERDNHLTDGEMLYKVAQGYAALVKRDDALRLLNRSIEQNFICYPYFAGDPLLDSLRGEPGFSDFL